MFTVKSTIGMIRVEGKTYTNVVLLYQEYT